MTNNPVEKWAKNSYIRVIEGKYTFPINKQKDVQLYSVKELENVAVVGIF